MLTLFAMPWINKLVTRFAAPTAILVLLILLLLLTTLLSNGTTCTLAVLVPTDSHSATCLCTQIIVERYCTHPQNLTISVI
jgi:hypothetical protein